MYIDVLMYGLILISYLLKLVGISILLINSIDILVCKIYHKKSLLRYI